MKGRGADLNPKNRFNSLNYSNDPEYDGSDVKVKTDFLTTFQNRYYQQITVRIYPLM